MHILAWNFGSFQGGIPLSELILTKLMKGQLINYTFKNKCSVKAGLAS